VYRLASGYRKKKTKISTLRKPDGSLTIESPETLRLILEYFTPEDKDMDDNNQHKHIRELTDKQPNTPDDREFTREEIGSVFKGISYNKATGETE